MPGGFRVFTNLEEATGQFGPSAVTIGNFDGVHRGHQRLLQRVGEEAQVQGLRPSVVTFDPHPAQVVAPGRAPRLLNTPRQRTEWMRRAGIEQVLILPFDLPFSQRPAEDFVGDVLAARLGARVVVVGENFRFGRGHLGDTALLVSLGSRYGYKVSVVPALRVRGRMVSSSEVRRLVEAGKVALAARLLGHAFALSGDIVTGRGVGSRKTVPTLNLAAGSGVLPATGVYVTRTRELDNGRAWPSVTNVGCRPTFGGGDLIVETFLLDPLEGETPRRISVEFLHRLREERKFEDAGRLREQILRDVARARAWHRRAKRWLRPVDILSG
jgi:riboflavin kinase/FMN adenylyltransferase